MEKEMEKEKNIIDKLEFEGEYLNGKKWNGKIYSFFNEDKFCELNNGNGLIKEYTGLGEVLYEEEYINGELYRKAKEYDKDKLIFEGEYLNGKRNGKGKEYIFGYQLIFEGEYLNGKRNGKGKEYNNKCDLIYEGEYLNGKRHGKGKEFTNLNLGLNKNYVETKEKIIFEGEYYLGFRLRGKKYIKGLLEFKGEYLFDRKYNGKGYDENGNLVYEIKNGAGKVKEFDNNFKLLFEGEYYFGRRNGKGKEYNCGKLIFEGEYLNGKRNGKGKEYDYNGNLIFEGKYLNGESIDKCLIL